MRSEKRGHSWRVGPLNGGGIPGIVLSVLLQFASLSRTRAEDRVDYRFEDYAEENDRIHVQTHGVYIDKSLGSDISLKANFIYDAISGATPTGAPWLPGTNAVNTAKMDDTRYAGFIESSFRLSNHTLSPQFSYSEESDYRSIGIALTDAIDFNEKNTTLSIGVSHSFDQILPNEGELHTPEALPLTSPLDKNTTDVLLGVTQLLGPATLLSANVTVGYSHGYLSDPYKRVLFDDFPYNQGDPQNPNAYTVWPENRPDHKLREVGFLSLSHNFESLNGAAEATYRFHHDDFGIVAHTASIQWNQKIGKHFTLSPLFRFHTQTAANFYDTHFSGDPTDQATHPLPKYYSSDYRLSAMNTFTYGVVASVKFSEHASVDLCYKRYETKGTDGRTSAQQYPKANVFGAGITIWF